jgi:hypothetical protein
MKDMDRVVGLDRCGRPLPKNPVYRQAKKALQIRVAKGIRLIGDMDRVAEAIRLEMRTLNVGWFVVDAAAEPINGSRDMTPYRLLALAAIKALSGKQCPEQHDTTGAGKKPHPG